MHISIIICFLIALFIVTASSEDMAELRAQQLVARKTLIEHRLNKNRSKQNGNVIRNND